MAASGGSQQKISADPFDPSQPLDLPNPDLATTNPAHPPQPIYDDTDSGMSKAEKVERHGIYSVPSEHEKLEEENSDHPAKRQKMDIENGVAHQNGTISELRLERQKLAILGR